MKCGDEKITCRELTVTISYVTILNFPPPLPYPFISSHLAVNFLNPLPPCTLLTTTDPPSTPPRSSNPSLPLPPRQ